MASQEIVAPVETGVQIICARLNPAPSGVGFRRLPRKRSGVRRNDGKTKIQAFYKIVKFKLISYFPQKVNDFNKLQEQKKCRMLKFDGLVKSPSAALCFNPAPVDNNPAPAIQGQIRRVTSFSKGSNGVNRCSAPCIWSFLRDYQILNYFELSPRKRLDIQISNPFWKA